MSFYLDTSLLVSLLAEETGTARSEAWLAARLDDPKIISWWVEAEWASAMSRKTGAGAIDSAGLALLRGAFHTLRDQSLGVVPVEQRHFQLACELAERSVGLRAGDALHLAVAATHEAVVVTMDRGMAAAAMALGLPHEFV